MSLLSPEHEFVLTLLTLVVFRVTGVLLAVQLGLFDKTDEE